MATLGALRTGVKTTLEAAISSVHCYDEVASVTVIPQGGAAVVVMPVDADFLVAMGRGTDTWRFRLLVLVNPVDAELGQSQLDPYVSGAGSSSIRQALFGSTLGLTDVHAFVTGMSGYGGGFESAGVPHIGAVLALTIHNPGTV